MPSKELFVSVIYYEGTAAGRIRAESSSNVVAFRIPRIKAADFRNDPELKRAGIYFLLNTVSKSIYVGQADARSNGNGILGRMTEPHSRPEIDDWDVGIALTNNSALFFDATKLNYLERLFYDKAKIVNKYSLLNGNAPSSTTINPADKIMSQNYCDSSLFVLENILKIDAFSESVSEMFRSAFR